MSETYFVIAERQGGWKVIGEHGKFTDAVRMAEQSPASAGDVMLILVTDGTMVRTICQKEPQGWVGAKYPRYLLDAPNLCRELAAWAAGHR